VEEEEVIPSKVAVEEEVEGKAMLDEAEADAALKEEVKVGEAVTG